MPVSLNRRKPFLPIAGVSLVARTLFMTDLPSVFKANSSNSGWERTPIHCLYLEVFLRAWTSLLQQPHRELLELLLIQRGSSGVQLLHLLVNLPNRYSLEDLVHLQAGS